MNSAGAILKLKYCEAYVWKILQKAMNIGSYIRSLPEYRKAQENGKKFDFVAPIIVLEAMKFYEDHLIPNIAR